jgi:hypothetical protein
LRKEFRLSKIPFGSAEIPGRGREFLLFATMFRLALGLTQPPIQWVKGVISTGIKWLGHKTDHSYPSSDKVKNAGVIPPLPHTFSWHGA